MAMASRVFVIYLFVFVTIINVNASPAYDNLDCPVNEKYYKCHLEVCYKTCDNLSSPPPCPALSPDCYSPACVCIRDYLRNADGVCVPVSECRSNKLNESEQLEAH